MSTVLEQKKLETASLDHFAYDYRLGKKQDLSPVQYRGKSFASYTWQTTNTTTGFRKQHFKRELQAYQMPNGETFNIAIYTETRRSTITVWATVNNKIVIYSVYNNRKLTEWGRWQDGKFDTQFSENLLVKVGGEHHAASMMIASVENYIKSTYANLLNQPETVTDVTPAVPEPETVAQVDEQKQDLIARVLSSAVDKLKPAPTTIGTCRVKRGNLLMVREYEVVREWKPDHYLIKDPVVGGTFSRHISEIEMQNISLQAVA